MSTPSAWSGAAVVVAVLVLAFVPSPAVPILVVGSAVAALEVCRGRISAASVRDAVDPTTLAAVFALAVILGAVARTWDGPGRFIGNAGRTETAVVGALAAVGLNNLPAAVLLGSRPVLHPRALLLGLNLGPNLAVTGSLSALIWFRSAQAIGASPSAARVTRLGILLVPLTIGAALLALNLFSPAGL